MTTTLRPTSVAEQLRLLVGLDVEVESMIEGKKVGGGPCLLIGVTEQKDGTVYADFHEGWSIQVGEEGLVINHSTAKVEHCSFFAECVVRGYYPGLPLNYRLTTILQAHGVSS